MPIRPSKRISWEPEFRIRKRMPNNITALPSPFKDILVTFLIDVTKEGERLQDRYTKTVVQNLEQSFFESLKYAADHYGSGSTELVSREKTIYQSNKINFETEKNKSKYLQNTELFNMVESLGKLTGMALFLLYTLSDHIKKFTMHYIPEYERNVKKAAEIAKTNPDYKPYWTPEKLNEVKTFKELFEKNYNYSFDNIIKAFHDVGIIKYGIFSYKFLQLVAAEIKEQQVILRIRQLLARYS